MSFLTPVARTEITGLNAGWNTVTLSSFTSLGAATGIWLEFNTNSTGAAFGVRPLGSADAFTSAVLGRLRMFQPCKIISGQVELYTSNVTNGKWYVIAPESHINYLATPVEKGGAAAGVHALDYSSDLPSDAIDGTVVLQVSKSIKIGKTGTVSSQKYHQSFYRNIQVAELTGRSIEYQNGSIIVDSDIRLIGWAKKGAFKHSSTYTSRAVSAINTWEDLPDVSTDTVLDNWALGFDSGSSDSILNGMRTKGDTFNDTDTNSYIQHEWVVPSSAGVVQAFSANLILKFFRRGGWVATLAPSNINGIDRVVAGKLSTATLLDTSFLVTSFTLNDGNVSKVVPATLSSAGVYTFTPPTWIDGTTGLKFGAITITANNGTESTPGFSAVLVAPDNYTAQTLDSVNPLNYGAIFSPSLKIGSQVLFNYLHGLVYSDAIWDSNRTAYVGTTVVWDRDPDTYITRSGSIIIANESVDISPTPDTFGVATNAALNTVINAPKSITVLDVAPATDIPVVATGGIEYRVNTGSGFGAWTTANTNVRLNYVIEARMQSLNTFSAQKIGTLTVGGVPFTFTLTTRAINSIPNAVIVTWPADGIYISNAFNITGVDAAAVVTVQIGTLVNCTAQYSVNDGAYTSANTNVYLNDSVKIKLTVSDPDAVAPNATISFGGVPVTFYAPVNSQAVSLKQNNFVAQYM